MRPARPLAGWPLACCSTRHIQRCTAPPSSSACPVRHPPAQPAAGCTARCQVRAFQKHLHCRLGVPPPLAFALPWRCRHWAPLPCACVPLPTLGSPFPASATRARWRRPGAPTQSSARRPRPPWPCWRPGSPRRQAVGRRVGRRARASRCERASRGRWSVASARNAATGWHAASSDSGLKAV